MGTKTCYIRLTQGLWAEVDEDDVEWISEHKWYAKRTTNIKCNYGNYYAARFTRKKGYGTTIYMHREIMDCPQSMEVDHKNRDSLCNKRENLRVSTREENNRNRYKT